MKSFLKFITEESRKEWHRDLGMEDVEDRGDYEIRTAHNQNSGHVRVVHKPSKQNIALMWTERRWFNDGDGKWQAHNITVDKYHRRKGIATMMYDHATANGMEMRPSLAQSEDAFQFWKSYKPEHMKGDLRMVRDQLYGLPISHQKYGEGNIETVGSKTVLVRKPNGNSYCMNRKELPQYEHIFKQAD